MEITSDPKLNPVQERLKFLLESKDNQGRGMYFDTYDSKLYLTEDKSEPKCIGRIAVGSNNILYTKFEDEKNIFRKTNAWSINYQVLKHVDHVHYETRTHDYHINKERVLEYGKFLHFSETTEKKIYVPLEYWESIHKGLKNINPVEHRLRLLFGNSWYEVLKNSLNSPFMQNLAKWVNERRKVVEVYPAKEDVFRAFKHCPFYHVKVVILGQDPYYTPNTADGLAFSFKGGLKQGSEKSLEVILKEIEDDCYNGCKVEKDYNLVGWAKQGVFLLNTCLTVEKGKPASHSKIGWQTFTNFVLVKLLQDPSPKVFLIWGNHAKTVINNALTSVGNVNNHLIIRGNHPASDLYKRNEGMQLIEDYPNTFIGGRYFSKANNFLIKHAKREIIW